MPLEVCGDWLYIVGVCVGGGMCVHLRIGVWGVVLHCRCVDGGVGGCVHVFVGVSVGVDCRYVCVGGDVGVCVDVSVVLSVGVDCRRVWVEVLVGVCTCA